MYKQESYNKVNYIAIFLIIYSSASFVCKNITGETVNAIIALIAIGMLAIVNRKLVIEKKVFYTSMVLITLSCVSSLIAGDTIKQIAYPAISMLIAAILISNYDVKSFCKIFTDIIAFLSFFSICIFIGYYLAPGIIKAAPVVINKAGSIAYNWFFCVVSPDRFFRNNGIFWEPGAFQTFINIAILFEIFSEEKNKKKKIITLYIALILTFSTTGFIAGIINLIIMILHESRFELTKKLKAILALLTIAILTYFILPLLPDTIGGVAFGFKKITMFLSGTSTNNNVTSASVRYDSIYYPLKYFFMHPIFGGANNGMDAIKQEMLHEMVTCTPANYFAMYGLFYGLIAFYGMYRSMGKYAKTRLLNILAFLMLLVSLFSEQYVNYIIINVFLLLGFKNDRVGMEEIQ